MTMAEQILAHHSGKNRVAPGDFVEASIDVAMVHEALGVTGGVADIFGGMGATDIWDHDKISLC